MAVHGRTRRPAASGEQPCTVWRNWVRKKMEPNIPKLNSMAVTLTEAKPRWRNSRMSSIGWSDRSSQATKATRATAPTTNEAEHRVAGPAVGVAPDQAEDHAEQPDADQSDAGQVEAGPHAPRLATASTRPAAPAPARPARSARRCTATTIRW